MKGKKRVQKGLKRIAISSSDRSVDQLERLADHMGLDLSKTLTILLEEFVNDEKVRQDFTVYSTEFNRMGQPDVGRTGLFRNYMLPLDTLADANLVKAKEKYGLSDFVRTLIYFNHDTKILSADIDLEAEVVSKIRDAGLTVVGYNQFEKILNVRVDISHLFPDN
jgi:hypothetical protein